MRNQKLKIKKNLKYNFKISSNGGFTLIELLVVIAVVALLMTLLFPNFMAARTRARDAQRKSDLVQIQKALELYKLDQNPPAYPTSVTGEFLEGTCGECWSTGSDCSGNIYMRKVPCDPGTTAGQSYLYTSDPNDNLLYTLSTCLENPVDPDKDATTVSGCSSTTNTSYTLNEP